MARTKESSKGFKLISASKAEMNRIGSEGICDHCNGAPEEGVYVAVLNHWVCDRCFEIWHRRAHKYEEDESIESRNFKEYEFLLTATKW